MAHKAHDLILRAAEAEFARCGFYGASTRSIAGAAGVHESTLFRVFESKESLFDQCFDDVISRSIDKYARIVALDAGGWQESMLAYAHSIRDAWTKESASILLFGLLERRKYARFTEIVAPATSPLRARIEVLQADGVLRAGNPFSIAEGIVDILLALYVFPKVYKEDRDNFWHSFPRDPDRIFEAFLDGMVTRNASAHSHSG